MSENKYRKIWISHNGPIPKDEYGETYQIHHIDGNRENNDISNLKCVSLMEHFDIHYKQKDWGACAKIMARAPERFDKQFISEIHSLFAKRTNPKEHHFNKPEIRAKIIANMKKRIKDGSFHLLSGKIQSATNKKLVSIGKHNFQGKEASEKVSKRNKELLRRGTHSFITKRIQINDKIRKKVADGEHHFQTKEHSNRVTRQNLEKSKNGTHNFQKYKTCKYCGFKGRGFGFLIAHDRYCLQNSNNELITCIHCGKLCHPSVYKRYHGTLCKHRQ